MEFKQIILKISKVSKIQKIQDKVSSQQNQPQAGKGPGEQGEEKRSQKKVIPPSSSLRKPDPAQLITIIPTSLTTFGHEPSTP